MELGLCMVVKNEERQIAACLGGILDLFDNVTIVDCGSSDATRRVLQDELYVAPILIDEPRTRAELRNEAFRRCGTGWVLSLDADERVSREHLESLRSDDAHLGCDGLFIPWITHRNGGPPIVDYKLALFRSSCRMRGLIHESVQPNLRDRGLEARWLDGLTLSHYPDASKDGLRRRSYTSLLRRGLSRNPDWVRYQWFLGYTAYRARQLETAIEMLDDVSRCASDRFPVECLNGAMVLAEIHAGRGEQHETLRALERARDFHDRVQDDFEVRVNFRMRPWIDEARNHAASGRLDRIRVYEFIY